MNLKCCCRLSSMLLLLWVFFVFQGCGLTYRQAKTLPQAESVRTTFVMTVKIDNSDETTMLRYKIRIPVDINYRQKIIAARFTPEPDSITDDGAERYAEYLLINPDDGLELKLEFDMEIYRYDMHLASNFNVDPEDELNPADFVKDEDKIESADPELLKMAQSIKGKNRQEIVENIYLKVLDVLEYDLTMGHTKSWKGAKVSAVQGSGVCSDYTDLFVALCRAKGIPARYVSGFVVSESSTGMGHAWGEVYFENKGWVRFDPTWGDDLLSDTDFYHNTPSYVEIMRSSRDNSTGYYYSGAAPKISVEVESRNIKELNTFNSKASSGYFEDLIKDPVFKDMLARYRKIYAGYAGSLSIATEKKERLIRISELVFKEVPLDSSEVAELNKFIQDTVSAAPGTKFEKQLGRRFMWISGYRLRIEKKNSVSSNNGGAQ